MSEEWKALETEVLAALKAGVEDFKDDVKEEAEEFLKKKAKQIAEQKWRSLTASTDSEKEVAKQNLKHLAAQVQGEVIRLELAATKEAGNLLGKVLSVVADTVLRIAPSLLGAP